MYRDRIKIRNKINLEDHKNKLELLRFNRTGLSHFDVYTRSFGSRFAREIQERSNRNCYRFFSWSRKFAKEFWQEINNLYSEDAEERLLSILILDHVWIMLWLEKALESYFTHMKSLIKNFAQNLGQYMLNVKRCPLKFKEQSLTSFILPTMDEKQCYLLENRIMRKQMPLLSTRGKIDLITYVNLIILQICSQSN
ncbi:MAG: hypothetical protein ACTSRK_19995 [Promethearchaeota archaeon]